MPDEPEVQQPSEPAAPPELPDFDTALAALGHHIRENPEQRNVLRSNDIIAGIAGEIGQHIAQRQLQQSNAAAAQKAIEEDRQRRRTLAAEDPDAFAAEYLADEDRELETRNEQRIASVERKRLADDLGRAFDDLPDGKMTRDEVSQLAQKLAGVPENKVMAVYTAFRAHVIADRRAEALAEARLNDRVAAEVEARETARAAKSAKSAAAPNLRTGNAPNRDTDEPDYRTDRRAWDEWYERTVLKRPARMS